MFNFMLRRMVRIYPFSKGRYRIMKWAESLLSPSKVELFDLHGRLRFQLNLARGGLQSSFFFFLPEYYEPATQKYARENIKSGMTVMDIGANIGFHTLLFADLVGPSGRVFSLEPQSDNFRHLQGSIAINRLDWVRAYRLALFDTTGTKKLYLSAVEDAAHTLTNAFRDTGDQSAQSSPPSTEEVPTFTLDEFLEQEKIEEVNLIKIDTEGSEARILRGAKKTLGNQKAPRVICEIHSTKNNSEEVGRDRVRELFYNYGYKSYFLQKKYLAELLPSEPVVGLQNILFVKK